MLISCTYNDRDKRLNEIAGIVSDSSAVALTRLDSISPSDLSTADRHYRDLLIIKARDKSYIPHKSDSLIMTIVDYAENHKNLDWYPEALYYAARVYSDLGDSPRALQFFHSALEALPKNNEDLKLKSTILSQTARLLNKLRLYDEAEPMLKKCIEINQVVKDSVNEYYDILMLGELYLRKDEILSAEKCFKKALALSKNLPQAFESRANMYLAVCSHKNDDDKKALSQMYKAMNSIDSLTYSTLLAYTAQIYKSMGNNDSAFFYARKLLELSSNNHNRHIAYQILLSRDIRKMSGENTTEALLNDYVSELEHSFDESQQSLAIDQQTAYNYSRHDKDRNNAELSKRKYQMWFFVSLSVAFGLLTLVIFLKYRSNLQLVKLQQYLSHITQLQEELDNQNKDKNHTNALNPPKIPVLISADTVSEKDKLKAILRSKLDMIASSLDNVDSVDESILKTKMYKTLQRYIINHEVLHEKHEFWKTIEETLLHTSPDFKHRLDLLSGGKIKTEEFRTAMLVKCGVTPTEMSILMSKSKPAITYRRKMLGNFMFEEDLNPSLIDKIIRSL